MLGGNPTSIVNHDHYHYQKLLCCAKCSCDKKMHYLWTRPDYLPSSNQSSKGLSCWSMLPKELSVEHGVRWHLYVLELIWNIHISCMTYGVRYNKYCHPTGNSYNNLTPWRQKRWTLWKLIWWQCDIKSYYIMIMDMSMWRLTVPVHKTNDVDRQHQILKIWDSAARRSFLL